MAALLDTHALVWLLEGNEHLGETSRDLVRAAATNRTLYVSAITPWETSMLVTKGRLAFNREVGQWLNVALAMPGMSLIPLSVEISVASTRLPGDFHADPADRIIVATARQFGATLITEDKLILDYAQAGHVQVHRAGL